MPKCNIEIKGLSKAEGALEIAITKKQRIVSEIILQLLKLVDFETAAVNSPNPNFELLLSLYNKLNIYDLKMKFKESSSKIKDDIDMLSHQINEELGILQTYQTDLDVINHYTSCSYLFEEDDEREEDIFESKVSIQSEGRIKL